MNLVAFDQFLGLACAGCRIGLGVFDNHPDLFSQDTTGRIGLFDRHGDPAPFGSAQIGIITAGRADNTQPDFIVGRLGRNDHQSQRQRQNTSIPG